MPVGHQYKFRVLAFNALGDSPPSNQSTVDYFLPAAVTNLQVTAELPDDTKLIWSDSDIETGYRIEKYLNNGNGWIITEYELPANTTEYEPNLPAGYTYTFRVIPFNVIDDGELSETLPVSLEAPVQQIIGKYHEFNGISSLSVIWGVPDEDPNSLNPYFVERWNPTNRKWLKLGLFGAFKIGHTWGAGLTAPQGRSVYHLRLGLDPDYNPFTKNDVIFDEIVVVPPGMTPGGETTPPPTPPPPGVDLRLDSNNDGEVGPLDEDAEQERPGKLIVVNDGDRNDNGVLDWRTESRASAAAK